MDDVGWRIARSVYPVLATVAATGICLNTILLLTTITTKSLRSTANILIGCCALFDVIHQCGYFIQFPILFSDYYIDSFACSCMMFIPQLGLSAGACCVLCIGIDRMLSLVIAIRYNQLKSFYFLKFHFLFIALFCGWTGYLMIGFWTSKKLICSMPSPFHGNAMELRYQSVNILNVASAILYFITWRTLKKRGVSSHSKKIFHSIAIVMIFEVTGWFISSTLINLSFFLAPPERRPPFHYCACLAVNVGIAAKVIVYYSISGEYRRSIRAFLGLKENSVGNNSSGSAARTSQQYELSSR
ncbi:hypothetical protein PENTCL1PPCAC_30322, partial [Pristionchus entomophagus]